MVKFKGARRQTEFDVWLNKMCGEHGEAAARGQWDGLKITEYYSECRKMHLKQGVVTVLTRDVDYFVSDRFQSPYLDRCFNLSVAAFSPVNMMPEAHRQDVAIKIVRRMFWPHAGHVWVQPPGAGSGYAGDIWHYLLFCRPGTWVPESHLPEDAKEELRSKGLISFRDLQVSSQSASE